MVSVCLILGIVLVAVAAFAAVFRRPEREPKLSTKGKAAGNKRCGAPARACDTAMFDLESGFILNLDAFDGPEFSGSMRACVADAASPASIFVVDEDFGGDDLAGILKPEQPSLMLASLIEVQQAQCMTEAAAPRPRILGDDARDLGIRYFDFLMAHHVVPRGARHLTSEANIAVAKNALLTSRQSATLSHGAVAQRIGERAVCLFEPLRQPVVNVEKALELLDEIFLNKTVFVVMSNADDADPSCLAHINSVCAKYRIPKTCIYIEQGDGSFINYLEDVSDFVPSRIDPFCMPQGFFSEMLDYAHNAYDEGDFEAVLRTIAPIIAPVCHRVQVRRNFPKVLLAQALNLMGMTHRDIGHDDEAIECFELSLNLLREIEDYEALKSVMANLGITLALSKPVTQGKIELAIRRLNEVTQLNPRDDEAWLYLANSYLELYRITSAQSLLRRALRAYDKAYDLAPASEIASCMEALERQIGIRPSGYQPDPGAQNVGQKAKDVPSVRSGLQN